MSDELEKAEQFKRLFIDPAVEAMCERIDTHIAPIVAKQLAQDKKIAEHDEEIATLNKLKWKALLGYSVYATALAALFASIWGWAKSHFRWSS